MSHVVIAPAIQVVVGSRALFLETGAVVPEGVPAADLERLEREGFIGEFVPPEVDEAPASTSFSQADVDAAVKAAVEAKDAELADAKVELEKERDALAADRTAFEQAQEAAKKSAPATKPAAGK